MILITCDIACLTPKAYKYLQLLCLKSFLKTKDWHLAIYVTRIWFFAGRHWA